MSEPNAPEPTMEEILASIRRIISEDEPPPSAEAAPEPLPELTPAAPPPLVAEHEDVLELTDPVRDSSPFESIGDLDIMPAHGAAPPPSPVVAPAPDSAAYAYESPFDDEPLVGPSASDSAASAFGHLAQHLLMPAEGRTLEDVVRELLRPMLKTWLDTHLPGIVQSKVDEEVARISRRRV